MAHQSLYRKYRPQTFGDLVGQAHVTVALRNAVRDDRVGHAYLFSGPRGTGKTSTARILAKALNCSGPRPDGEPDGECESCLAIANGSSLDVIEIDAASNNGVDEIRELIDRVAYRSAGGGRKVYIIDEVHELTARASNALLKTLEEPPEHVIFVLATTNPEKVLPTIRSRTQHLEFSLLTTEELRGHLAAILALEGVEADDESLMLIARRGAGSARDALSLLDQALAAGIGKLDAETVGQLFGGSPFELRAAILDALAAEDAGGALLALQALLDAGHDPRRSAEDLLRSLRDAFLLTASGGRASVDAPAEQIEHLRTIGETLGTGPLVRSLETLGQAVVDMRGTDAADPRLVLEIALLRLARRDIGPPLQSLADRVDRLERAADAGAATARPVPTPPAAPGPSVSQPDAVTAAREKLEQIERDTGRGGPPPAETAEPSAPAAAPPAAAVPPAEPQVPGSEPPSGPATARRALGGVRRDAPQQSPAPPAASVPAAPEPPIAPEVEASSEPVDIDEVILAWPQTLAGLPIATRSSVQEAQPLRMEGDVVVFGVPPRVIEAARPRFQREADAIRDSLAAQVGRKLRFKIVPHDFAESRSIDLTDPAPTAHDDIPPGEPPPHDDEVEEYIDPSQLTDAPAGAGAVDSVSRLVETFGAEVVDEQRRT
jgi:DNA polymerase-3 subunit gamma/tau